MVGFEFKRMLGQSERDVIREAWDACQPYNPKNADAIYWTNVFTNGRFNIDHDFSELASFVAKTVKEMYPDQEKVVLGYGFLVNPNGTKKGQPFHVDYSGTDSSIYVPLTHLTHENAMQYVPHKIARTPIPTFAAGIERAQDMLETEGVDMMEVRQIICKPYALLHMLPGTIHRGIPNTSGYDRSLFWITVDDYYHELVEPVTYEYSSDKYGPV